jgi:hypothetical protein
MLHDCISYYLYGHDIRCERNLIAIERSHKIHVGYSARGELFLLGERMKKIGLQKSKQMPSLWKSLDQQPDKSFLDYLSHPAPLTLQKNPACSCSD